jgi:hypothetical protein
MYRHQKYSSKTTSNQRNLYRETPDTLRLNSSEATHVTQQRLIEPRRIDIV